MTEWLVVKPAQTQVAPIRYWTGGMAEQRSLCQPVGTLDIDDAKRWASKEDALAFVWATDPRIWAAGYELVEVEE